MAGAAAPVSAADHTTAASGAAAAATPQASAAPAAAEAEKSQQVSSQEKEQAASQGGAHAIDIQMDYFEGRFFKERNIDLYNFHVFWQNRTVHHIKTYYGLTVER
ncbi:MAG: acyloxyacyl hydrolase, partial [Selenomonas sp.]|nr:acyloxyacyl hydrolase [Selenomonas sp.]